MAYPERRGGRATGRWYGEVKHPKAGRFRRRFKDMQAAVAYEEHVRAFGEEPEWSLTEVETAEDAFSAVLDALEQAGGPNGTWRSKRDPSGARRRWWVKNSKIGRTPVNLVTRKLVDEVITKGIGGKLKPATINKYLTVIHATLEYAEACEMITGIPKLPWQKVPKHYQPKYTQKDVRAVVEALAGHGWPVEAFCFDMMEFTGFRAGEWLGLNEDNIVDDEFIALTDIRAVKTEKSLRMACIGVENVAVLRGYLAAGSLPAVRTLYYRVGVALKTCGINIPRRLHALRHTFASRTVNSGIDLQEAQELLGHVDPSTTVKYREMDKDVLRERAKKLARGRGITLGGASKGV